MFFTISLEYGKPLNENGKKQNLIIIGMGKLGGKELNPSSDIDLVFLYIFKRFIILKALNEEKL